VAGGVPAAVCAASGAVEPALCSPAAPVRLALRRTGRLRGRLLITSRSESGFSGTRPSCQVLKLRRAVPNVETKAHLPRNRWCRLVDFRK
jgi:hypothetical protein